MVAIGEVLGVRHNYYHEFSGEWGFLGIAVALLGRNHPLGVFIAALFFGVLLRGEIFVDALYKICFQRPRMGFAGDNNSVRRVSSDVFTLDTYKGKV
jgi:hypothetical protein